MEVETVSRLGRLGGGTYGWPDEPWVREDARRRFLAAIQSQEPAVLRDLAGEPFANYRPLCPLDRPLPEGFPPWYGPTSPLQPRYYVGEPVYVMYRNPMQPIPNAADDFATRTDREGSEFWASVLAWAKRHRLFGDPWVINAAVNTLGRWRLNPALYRVGEAWAPSSNGLTLSAFTEDERRFQFEHDGWDPQFEIRADAEAKIRAAFEGDLDRYFARLDRLALERGLATNPEKRTVEEHFRWLARYQVEGRAYSEIARSVGRHRNTVITAVKTAADLIGLDLRVPDPPGRPPSKPAATRRPARGAGARIARLR